MGNGLVLCGPPSRTQGVELFGLNALISTLSSLQGSQAFSSIPDKLTFQKYQKNLILRAKCVEKTGYEWLSRDEQEVQKYVNDPFCGHPMSNGWFKGLVPLIRSLNTPAAVPPPSVPVLLIQGESDTCGINDRGTYSCMDIQSLYSSTGRSPPKVVLYPDARHELLHETCHLEVTNDILEFLGACLRKSPRSRL